MKWGYKKVTLLHAAMASGGKDEDLPDLLTKTEIKQLNVISLPEKGVKLDTAEDGNYL